MIFFPSKMSDLPIGAVWEGGNCASKTGDWKSFRPVIDRTMCSNCLQCYIFCPEGTIVRKEKYVAVFLDFCKGCGICANVCPKKAVEMVKEG